MCIKEDQPMSRKSNKTPAYAKVTFLSKRDCELLKNLCKEEGLSIAKTIENCLKEKFITCHVKSKQLDFYGKLSNMLCYVLGISNLEAISLITKHFRVRNFKSSFDTNKIIVESLCSLLLICTKDEKQCISSAVNGRKYTKID